MELFPWSRIPVNISGRQIRYFFFAESRVSQNHVWMICQGDRHWIYKLHGENWGHSCCILSVIFALEDHAIAIIVNLKQHTDSYFFKGIPVRWSFISCSRIVGRCKYKAAHRQKRTWRAEIHTYHSGPLRVREIGILVVTAYESGRENFIMVQLTSYLTRTQGAEEFARSFASSFTLCTATHIDVRAIPLSVWRRIAGERRWARGKRPSKLLCTLWPEY